ncbi:MAG: hypothetical protein WDO15_11460 [Bacteroidota bacterium]
MSYNVSDIFFYSWKALDPKQHAEVVGAVEQYRSSEGVKRGYWRIMILKALRRNKKLASKITPEQAVDIVDDLVFLNQPWYHFPVLEIGQYKSPTDHMSRLSFDHFIYADNEFTCAIAFPHEHKKYAARLAATIYAIPGEQFDKELVADSSGRNTCDRKRLAACTGCFHFQSHSSVHRQSL